MIVAPAPARALALPVPWIRGRLSGWALDLVAVSGLSLAALFIRWPHVFAAPRFTDEILEVLHGLAIAQGRSLPLTHFDSYNGALHAYLLAGLFALFGADPWSPRLVSLALGSATVGLTYLLAREIGGRLAGLVAGAMMAVAAVHVVVNSHVAWSNSITPFFSTLAAWLLIRAVRCGSGASLAGSGLAFGLALQTHPLVAAFLPAAGLYVLWKGRSLLRTRWTLIAGLLLAVGYANMIAYNVQSDAGSLDHLQYRRTRPNYLQQGLLPEADPSRYVQNIGRTAVLFSQTSASAIDSGDTWPAPATGLAAAAGGLIVAAGLVWCARYGQPLPLLAVISLGLILPLVNPGRYQPITEGRYLSPLLPLCFASLAAALIARRWPSTSVQYLAVTAVLALFLLQPVGPLMRYYERIAAEVPSNQALASAVDRLAAESDGGDLVLLDNRLNLGAPNLVSLRESRAAFDGFTYLLSFTDLRFSVGQVTRAEVSRRLEERSRVFAIVPMGYRIELLAGRPTRLVSPDVPIPDDPAAPGRQLYRLYVVERVPS